MRAALGVLALQPGRHVAVLGDMLELGEAAEAEHLGAAAGCAERRDMVFTCGPMMGILFDSLPQAKQGAHAADAASSGAAGEGGAPRGRCGAGEGQLWQPDARCDLCSGKPRLMLYALLLPLAGHVHVFNLFRYITFRAGGACLTALIISFWLGPKLIRC